MRDRRWGGISDQSNFQSFGAPDVCPPTGIGRSSHTLDHFQWLVVQSPQVQACFEADTEINLFDSPSREFVREGVLLKQAGKGEQPSRKDLVGAILDMNQKDLVGVISN